MRHLLLPALLLCAAPAAAEDVLLPGFEACVAARPDTASACIDPAQNACLALPAPGEAATACFLSAKDDWSGRMKALMDGFIAGATEREGQIAAIEAQYSIRRNLLECDRQLDLMTLNPEIGTEVLAYARARCEASAVASSLVTMTLLTARLK